MTSAMSRFGPSPRRCRPDNLETIVKDLETENVQTIVQMYCPRKVTIRPRLTNHLANLVTNHVANCGPREVSRVNLEKRAESEKRAETGIERGPICLEAMKAAVVKVFKKFLRETVKLKRRPGESKLHRNENFGALRPQRHRYIATRKLRVLRRHNTGTVVTDRSG